MHCTEAFIYVILASGVILGQHCHLLAIWVYFRDRNKNNRIEKLINVGNFSHLYANSFTSFSDLNFSVK